MPSYQQLCEDSSVLASKLTDVLTLSASGCSCFEVLRNGGIQEKGECAMYFPWGPFCFPHNVHQCSLGDSRQLFSQIHQHQPGDDLGSPAFLSPSRNIRVAILPCSESTTCLFRTRPLDAVDTLVFNEVFWVSMSYPALHQKTLRVDVCTSDRSHLEECLVRPASVCLFSLPSFWGVVCLHFRGKAWRKRVVVSVKLIVGSRQELFHR